MSWEIAMVGCYVAIAWFFLHIGLKGDNKQLPLKLIFITLAFGSLLFAVNTNIILTQYAEPIINDTAIYNMLLDNNESAYGLLGKVFWLFLIITFFTVLFEVVKLLIKRKK